MKAAEQGVAVIAANEAYTSQQCSACGQVAKRDSTRVFHCPECNLTTHRDAGNSAPNIAVRTLTLGALVAGALAAAGAGRNA